MANKWILISVILAQFNWLLLKKLLWILFSAQPLHSSLKLWMYFWLVQPYCKDGAISCFLFPLGQKIWMSYKTSGDSMQLSGLHFLNQFLLTPFASIPSTNWPSSVNINGICQPPLMVSFSTSSSKPLSLKLPWQGSQNKMCNTRSLWQWDF